MPNPYSATTNLTSPAGVFADSAILVRSAFLYRQIRLSDLPSRTPQQTLGRPNQPEQYEVTYSGWWSWQRVRVNGQLVWSKVSWVALNRHIEFQIPSANGDEFERQGEIEIDFAPGLRIKRFRLTVEGQIVLDQIR